MEAMAQETPPVLRADQLELRPEEYLGLAGGPRGAGAGAELDLLTALMERADRIVSRDELYRVVWGDFRRKSDRSVDVYVARIRHKLCDAIPEGRFIHPHFGFGYRFKPEPSR